MVFAPVIVLAVCRNPLTGRSDGYDSLDGPGMLFTMACYGALVFLAAERQIARAFPSWASRGLFYIGERSYTIYLLHFPCMVVGWVILVVTRPEWTSLAFTYAWAQPVATALLLVPLTEISYRFVEGPGSELGGRLASRWREMSSGPIAATVGDPS